MTSSVIGVMVGTLGLLVLLGALFTDRARGRSRCPRCWYDMAAHRESSASTCPECGHRVKRERQFGKTRRHLRIATIGLAILLGGAATVTTAEVRKRGWTNVCPTTVLLFMIPSIDDDASPVAVELNERLAVETWRNRKEAGPDDLGLWPWQRRLLANRCMRAIEDDRHPAARKLAVTLCWGLGPEVEPMLAEMLEQLAPGDPSLTYQVLRMIGRSGATDTDCVPAIIDLLARDRSEWYHVTTAVRVLGMFGAEARPAVPVLVDILRAQAGERSRYSSSSLRLQLTTLETLGTIGPEAERALPLLAQSVRDRACPTRAAMLETIGKIDARRPEATVAVISALKDVEATARVAAADLARRHPPLLERSVASLVLDLESGSPPERIGAARGLMTLGLGAQRAVPALGGALADEEILVRLFATRALASMGAAARTATADLQKAANDSDESVRREAVLALAALHANVE